MMLLKLKRQHLGNKEILLRSSIFCTFILILFTLISCQEKRASKINPPATEKIEKPESPFKMTCEDLYSKTHEVMDNGLKLEIVEVAPQKFEANLFQVGFAGPVSIKKLDVTKVSQHNTETVFKGEKFYFTEKDLSG